MIFILHESFSDWVHLLFVSYWLLMNPCAKRIKEREEREGERERERERKRGEKEKERVGVENRGREQKMGENN